MEVENLGEPSFVVFGTVFRIHYSKYGKIIKTAGIKPALWTKDQ